MYSEKKRRALFMALTATTAVGAIGAFQNCAEFTPAASSTSRDQASTVTEADFFSNTGARVKVDSINAAATNDNQHQLLTALIDNYCFVQLTTRPNSNRLADAIFSNYSSLTNVRYQAVTFNIPSGSTLNELEPLSQAVPCLIEITHAAPGRREQSQTTRSTQGTSSWLNAMKFPQAWALGQFSGSHQVVVAVVDSGVDESHADLRNRLVPGRNFGGSAVLQISTTTFQPVSDPVPDGITTPIRQGCRGGNHGTGVAGVVALATGLRNTDAPAALQAIKIMPLKIEASITYSGSGSMCSGTPAMAINAILHAAQQPEIDIINLSYSFPANESLERAIALAMARGKIVIHSAGNAGETNSASTPHAMSDRSGLIGVGGLILQSASSSENFALDTHSNRGANVSLAAISEPVMTLSWDQSMISQQGTSFASPMVAAAAALVIKQLKEQGRSYRPESVKALLLSSARRDERFNSLTAGEGRILDVEAAIRNIASQFPVSCTTPVSQAEYLSLYPDVASAGTNPFLHYQTFGRAEGRCPIQGACSIPVTHEEYLRLYPDVAQAGVRPRLHFNQSGRGEGRCPIGDLRFDPAAYLQANPDLQAAFGTDTNRAKEHYCQYVVSGQEARPLRPGAPAMPFNEDDYLIANPDVATAGVNAREHFCTHGYREGRNLK